MVNYQFKEHLENLVIVIYYRFFKTYIISIYIYIITMVNYPMIEYHYRKSFPHPASRRFHLALHLPHGVQLGDVRTRLATRDGWEGWWMLFGTPWEKNEPHEEIRVETLGKWENQGKI
jgi:hypothetical protein